MNLSNSLGGWAIPLGEYSRSKLVQTIPQSRHRYVDPVQPYIDANEKGSICIIAWTAAPTAAIYLAASVLQSTIAMNIPSYAPEGWQVTLMMWAVFALCTVLNTWLGIILPVIEVLILLVHVLGFFAVLIPLVYLGPKASAKSVFTTSFDYGGWNDLTLATFVGLKGTVAAFVGTDGAVHASTSIRWSFLANLYRWPKR